MFKKEKNSNLISKNTLRKIKKQVKGITLIALVVTIIVLLILAGVAINLTIGQNGLFTRAQDAREITEKEKIREEIELAIGGDNIGKYMDENGSLEEELNKIDGATITKVGKDVYYVEKDGYTYTVYEDGTIEDEKIDIWDGEKIEKPEVDEQGNWHIYTTGQMKYFADYCNDSLTEEEKTEANMPEIVDTTIVYLENDLDMGARQKDGVLVSGIKWTPINMRKGTFDGKEHYISGIYVQTQNSGGTGLFGGFYAKKIQNITIKNSYIESSKDKVGGICGATFGDISNCHNVNTTVKCSKEVSDVGGIVGVFLRI